MKAIPDYLLLVPAPLKLSEPYADQTLNLRGNHAMPSVCCLTHALFPDFVALGSMFSSFLAD